MGGRTQFHKEKKREREYLERERERERERDKKPSVFSGVRVIQSLFFCVVFYTSLCLSFLD